MRKRTLQADHELGEIQRLMPFTVVNPDNAEEVKKRFLKKPYEPTFTYGSTPELLDVQERLKNLKTGGFFYGKLLEEEREYLLQKAAMIQAIGTPTFGKHSKEVYGLPNKELVKQAKKFLEIKPVKEEKKIPYKEVQALMKETFNKLGFKYSIRRRQMISSAYLSNSQRQLHLKAKARFSKAYAYRLAVHELATHALRAENGREQKLQLFRRGTPNYLATEEGLAAYNEERAGVMNTNILRTYAGRVLAVHLAQTHTFVETYKQLLKHFPQEDAFTLTLRAKRGLDNGESRGGCSKDYVYLQGYLAIKDYVAQGRDLKELYRGKIALEDLKKLSGRHQLQAAKYIPEPVIEWVRQEQLNN